MDFVLCGARTIVESPPLTLGCVLAILFTVYYLFVIVKKPMIVCVDKRLSKLLSHCPISKEYYWPTWWCYQCHVMTMFRSLMQSQPHIDYRRQMLKTPDGGQVFVDWADNNDHTAYPASTRPTVILLPGLTGSSDDNYVRHIVEDVTKLGYRCVVFNSRGNGGTKLLTTRVFSATGTEDLAFVMKYIRSQLPDSPMMGVGISLGGVILFNYLIATGKESGMKAAMVISAGWNLMESTFSLEEPFTWLIFNKYLTSVLVKNIEKHKELFQHSEYDFELIQKSKTIREFDGALTAKQFGFKSVEQYYRAGSICFKVAQLEVPVFTLNAADDCFSPLHGIPLKDATENDNIAMVVTSHGGHIGFMEGAFPSNKNYMHRWISQFVDAVFQHGLTDD